MEDHRPNPDELLASLRQEEEKEHKGRLKIFFGMSPGVGKTYTMLQTAQADLAKGVHVVVGYVETHQRPETNALLEGLTIIPRKKLEYKGTTFEEMDLDEILAMHPYLVLVDELAHTNAPGSRHLKRYQDVQELLDNGINVYTTVNVQHLQSRNDTVAQITGITVRETLPDEIFEQADEVELVDITPDELFVRLAEGKVYTAERSKEAIKNFFRKGNITALREMSLRMVADRVDKQLKTYMQQKRIQGPWKSGMHLMVMIGASPTSAQLIHWAKTMASAAKADWIALYVDTGQEQGEREKKQLADNISLVRKMDGEVITTSGHDLVQACLEVARKENITHIIVGKSGKIASLTPAIARNRFVTRLIEESGNIDIYVLGSETSPANKSKSRFLLPTFTSKISEYLLAAGIVATTVLLCMPLVHEIGYQSVSFIMLFVLSILATFLRIGPILLAATLGALAWNYFFIPPQNTLHIYTTTDALTFLMFFFIALLNGIFTSRIRKQEKLAISREKQTNALFRLTKGLSNAQGIRSVIETSMENIRKYFDVEAFFMIQDGNGQLTNMKYLPKGQTFSDSELAVAAWVFKNARNAGRFTETLPSGKYTYYPLKGLHTKPGVLAVRLDKAFTGEKSIFWDTFLTQISSAIEQQYLGHATRKTTLLSESDKLYKTLFNSISQELKTPAATVMGSADMLRTNPYPDEVKSKLYEEIFKSSKSLNRLIENLLNMSQLESGKTSVHLDWCDIHELFHRVTESLADELQPFHTDVVIPESMPLVKLDFSLMEQVLQNLVYNSCQYAPPGSTIRLKAFYDSSRLIIQEMDRGPGLAPEVLPHMFDKFYHSQNCKSAKTEGLGLGLSIVKGFVEAHKGTISVENRQNGGVRFTIQIATEIMYKDE